jgi:hypothetical protein
MSKTWIELDKFSETSGRRLFDGATVGWFMYFFPPFGGEEIEASGKFVLIARVYSNRT